jgi:enoyl-[acyl-carrier protein] reductase I
MMQNAVRTSKCKSPSPQTIDYIRLTPQYKNAVFRTRNIALRGIKPTSTPVTQEDHMDIRNIISGKKGLIVGIANENSIAYGCASVLRELGAEVAVTYLNTKAEKYVRPLAEKLEARWYCRWTWNSRPDATGVCVSNNTGQAGLCHPLIAFAMEDLRRVVDCSREGFQQAMRYRLPPSLWKWPTSYEPLMKDGGSLITMSYYGRQVVENLQHDGPGEARTGCSAPTWPANGPQGVRACRLARPAQERDRLRHRPLRPADRRRHARAAAKQAGGYRGWGMTCAFLICRRQPDGQTIHVDGGHHSMA